MICGSGGSKSRLPKAAGAEPAGQMRDKKCTPLWREAHFQVKMYKTHQRRTTFGSCDVEKVHAVAAKHMSKSKCTKHIMLRPLLEVEMWKKCAPLWRRRKSKCTKNTMFGPLLDVQMCFRAAGARDCGPCQK